MKGEKCPICGAGNLSEKLTNFVAHMDTPTGKREVNVAGVLSFQCDNCGEEFLDPSSEDAIAAAQRQALGLLTPAEIRALRGPKTQAEMSELLGAGEKTYTRWESGSHFQSEASDRYLRLLIMAPANLELLALIGERKRNNELQNLRPPAAKFSFIKDRDSLANMDAKFTQIFTAGTVFAD